MAERTLVLLRHAKAESAAGTPDIDRRLTSRGHADAAAAGAWLGNQRCWPQLVICSPARRTRQTWHAIALALADIGPADATGATADTSRDTAATTSSAADSDPAGSGPAGSGSGPADIGVGTAQDSGAAGGAAPGAATTTQAPTVRYEQALYGSPATELLRLLQDIPDEMRSVLIIGHNPTISQLSALLDPHIDLDSDGLRTSGIAVHRVAGPWSGCGRQRAPLAATHTARS